MERLEDLNLSGIKIFQDDSLYSFTSDSLMLSRFASYKKGDTVADFCAGSGIVGFHYLALHPELSSLYLIELQKPLYDLTVKSIEYNNLSDKVFSLNIPVQQIPESFNGKFSLILCNPPYMKAGAGDGSQDENIRICKSEEKLTLKELIAAAKRALKFGGRLNLVHRADRLAEVVFELKSSGLEPKRICFISAKNKAPYLFMIEAVKGGKEGPCC